MRAAIAIARGAGQAAFARVGPFWVVLAIICAVVMGPTALTPADLIGALDSSRAARAGIWVLWLAGAAPAARAALARRDLLYLRSLPIGPATWCLSLAAIALAVQLPWGALFWIGGGAQAGAAAVLGAAGAGAGLAVRGRPGESLAGSALAAAVIFLVAAPAPSWALAAAGAIGLATFLPIAWRRVPTDGRRGGKVPIAGPAPIALAIYHAVGLWRRDGASLGRGLVLALAGGAAAGLAGVGTLGSLGIASATLTTGVFGIAAPVARARREAGWLLDSSGAGPVASAAAAGIVLFAWAGALGVAHAVLSGGGRPEAPVLFALALAAAAVPIARWADRPEGVEGTRVAVAGVLVAILALTVFGTIAALERPS